jgi:hypothetical protein
MLLTQKQEHAREFWGEAVRHVVYMLNRLPTKALADQTPFEAWNKRKPHLVHYGCLGVLHMSSHQLHT